MQKIVQIVKNLTNLLTYSPVLCDNHNDVLSLLKTHPNTTR